MWLIAPNTDGTFASFPSAPEEEDSISESSWLWDMLASSVAWSTKHSPSSTWRKRWKRSAWLRSLCGRILKPSTAQRGVDAWTSSLAATHASLSASSVDSVDQMILDICGPTFCEWSASVNRPSVFLRTSATTSARASMRSPEASKQWGTTLRRACLQRRKQARPISGRGCSSSPSEGMWRTAATSQPGTPLEKLSTKEGEEATLGCRLYRDGKDGQRINQTVSLEMQAKLMASDLFPTPYGFSAGNGPDGNEFSTAIRKWQQAADLWTTIRNSQGGMDPKGGGEGRGGANLQRQAVDVSKDLWGTMTCPAPHDSSKSAGRFRPDREFKELASQAARVWLALRSSLQDPSNSNNGEASSSDAPGLPRLYLNPLFVQWLMGWPVIAGIGSSFSATAWSHYRQRMRSALSGLVCDLPRTLENESEYFDEQAA